MSSSFSAFKNRSFAISYLLMVCPCLWTIPVGAQINTPMDQDPNREHKDFWQFLNKLEDRRYLERKMERRRQDLERRKEEEEKQERTPAPPPTPVDLTGSVLDASDKKTVDLHQSTSTIIGAQTQSSGKVMGGIKFADDPDDSDDPRTGGKSLDSPLTPTLKDDGRSKTDDKGPLADPVHADDRRGMLDSIDADYSDMDDDAAKKRKKEWHDMRAIPYTLQDWVPDQPDPTSNGGFGKEPDNGRPVPYKLNGHPDLDRKLPWKTAD